ncbi:cytochrome c oxidase assembly protein, partial [Pseudomonas aeruginosa]
FIGYRQPPKHGRHVTLADTLFHITARKPPVPVAGR